jgi:hypothetical protein
LRQADASAASSADLQTWFDDASGNEICGAYFVYAQRR